MARIRNSRCRKSHGRRIRFKLRDIDHCIILFMKTIKASHSLRSSPAPAPGLRWFHTANWKVKALYFLFRERAGPPSAAPKRFREVLMGHDYYYHNISDTIPGTHPKAPLAEWFYETLPSAKMVNEPRKTEKLAISHHRLVKLATTSSSIHVEKDGSLNPNSKESKTIIPTSCFVFWCDFEFSLESGVSAD